MSLLQYPRTNLDYSFLPSKDFLEKEILDEAPLSVLSVQYKSDSNLKEKTMSKPEIKDSRAELWKKMFGDEFVRDKSKDIVLEGAGKLSEGLDLTDDDIEQAIKKANN